MFAGFIAVFAAILYKINSYEPDPGAAAFAETIVVGPDAEVLQASVSDGMMLVLVKEGEATLLLRFDPATGEQLGRTEFIAR